MLEPSFREREDGFQKLKSNENGFVKQSYEWMESAVDNGYYYQWNWQGIPLIHLPQDVMIVQSIIYETMPKMIIETGIARGGSLVLHASLMKMNMGMNIQDSNTNLVIGIDMEIRNHTKESIKNSIFKNHIQMIEADSVSKEALDKVKVLIGEETEVMICLDSNHTHDHVLSELNCFANLVGVGQYLIVYDTVISYMPERHNNNRHWCKEQNPMTAVDEFLATDRRFIRDEKYDTIGLPHSSPGGILKRIS